MVLKLPALEFTEALTDSPEFREKLRQHENELENTSNAIKTLIKKLNEVMVANKTLSKASRSVAETLKSFKFFVVGSKQTDEERDIESSLSYMGEVLHRIEEARDALNVSSETYLKKLDEFRKTTIGKAKNKKKEFDKTTQRYCAMVENNMKIPTKRSDLFQEADANLQMQTKKFREETLDYVFLLQQVQERKKFDFVETLLALMLNFLSFYHAGQEIYKEFDYFIRFLHHRVLKCRENFDCFQREGEDLKWKMLMRPEEHLLKNQEFDREGYLFLIERNKIIGTTAATKHYCQYRKDIGLLRLITFTQTSTKQLTPYDVFVRHCFVHPADEKLDKRFMFDLHVIEKGASSEKMLIFTFQAMNEEDFEGWVSITGGLIHVSKPELSSKPEMQNELDDSGIDFVKKCIQVIERRGLDEQGLYRVVGMQSKVNSVVAGHFDAHKTLAQRLATPVEEDIELKTICSALKLYLRTLKEPVFTFKLHNRFIEAAMIDDKADRIRTLHTLLKELPKHNYDLLYILMSHLHKVSQHNEKNLMTPVNLGVCFGPSLLRPEFETVSSIYDIKFRNAIVELIIIHNEKMFQSKLEQQDIDEMVGSSEQDQPTGVNLSNSLSSLASIVRRAPPPTNDMIETTADARRRGLYNPDYHINETNKHLFPPMPEDTVRKESSSSSSLESLSNISATVQPTPSLNPFSGISSQIRSISSSSSSFAKQISLSDTQSRLSTASTNLSISSKTEPTITPSSTIRKSSITNIANPTPKLPTRGVTLYPCAADNDSELSFNANEIVTQIRSSKEPGWLMGTINGKTGLIPENYINFTGGV
ncbi:unnamed protein product [Rotaria socialis]|uniref:Rho GTPase-activating protein 26 n=8 Tax=Rotaria socialis TaxID=392032 RepID=A0A820R996_9BILA|nr:unnamed protein product [Rotaria socialis]CAF3374081.1 unnamed protein product [Rotaria socialis]CAF3412078.1 unnamed protein product [Rotaria socialis]CAF3626321.1 unnamed protein product [Rotaria socialis]CAF4297919.1 unnamed protein product [Rotaria socialis]